MNDESMNAWTDMRCILAEFVLHSIYLVFANEKPKGG